MIQVRGMVLPIVREGGLFFSPEGSGGNLVIIQLDGRNGDPQDDITFRSSLLIRAIPPLVP